MTWLFNNSHNLQNYRFKERMLDMIKIQKKEYSKYKKNISN